jgi:hypothetical protein
MATYNFDSTGSTEYLPVNLSASEEIVFHVTNSNEGSSYFTIETYPDNNGAYSSNAPKNASGSYVSSSGITTIVSDDYHMSAVVENGGGTITFAPADFVSGSDLKVRGVGAKTDYASTIDRWPNAAAAYSLRRLNSYYEGSAIKVRRSVDNEEKDINFIGTSLDTTSLTTFTVPTSSVLPSNYGSEAAAAYSLRYVSSTYTGPVVKVRRSNDDNELDFTPSEITDGTLETWVGANNGFVTTWYDQSGNGRNATQTTATYQPQIVSSGTLIKENGIPTTQYDGVNDYLQINNSSATGSNPINISGSSVSVFTVLTPTNNNSAYIFGNYQGSGVYDGDHVLFHQDPSGSGITFKNSYDDNVNPIQELSSLYSINTTYLWTNILSLGSTAFMYVNNSLESSTSDTTDGNFTSDQDWVIGARSIDPSVEVWGGKMSEIILHKSDQSSNRQDIESNINNYYNIFDYNAYVATWYDQSGNGNDAIQSTADGQPVIVSGSQIYTLQSQPALHTFSSSLDLTSTLSFEDLTWYVVSKKRGLGSLGSIMFAGGGSSIYGGENVDGRGIPVMYAAGRRISTEDNNASLPEFSLIPHITFYNTSGSTAVGGVNLEVNPSAGVGSTSFPLTGLFQYVDAYPQYQYDGLTSEIILYSQSLKDNRFNLQSSINSHYKIYWDGATSRLLNSYSGSAAAYSLRALNQEYTGSLIRVRRANNSDEINIGADYEGNLDTNLLEQFCDGTDGFVTTWYDQSGNGNDATQGTATYQPQIVSSGNVLTLNNKPTVYFDRATVNKKLYNASVNVSGDASFEWVGSIDYPLNLGYQGGWSYLFGVGTYSGTSGFVYTPYTAQNVNDWQAGEAFFGGDGYSPSSYPRFVSTGSVYVAKAQHSTFGTLGSNNTLYINNILAPTRVSVTGSIPSATGLYVGGHDYGEALTGSIQEFILYNEDKTSIREGFESNINSYYNIY